MYKGLLPIGTVVLIGNGKKKVMIIGVGQVELNEAGKVWDYVGVIYPEGYLDAERMLLFNNEQITKVFFMGYQDDEQDIFKKIAEQKISEIKKG